MDDDYTDDRDAAEERRGSIVGNRWRLLRTIATGGSGWVYVAADSNAPGGLAAVKILHRAFLEHPEIVARFVREARIAKALDHRGVVQVLDEGRTDDGVPFIAMELLDGETLENRRVRKGGRLPPHEVLWAMDEVLSALGVAHKKNILHRDVKPDNIFLTSAHAIKLLDFGIARSEDGGRPPEESTRVGTMMGTLDFMSPEQGRGEWATVSAATDLWAVGATMFALLSGRTVHNEDDLAAQMAAVMTRAAPPMALVAPDVPRVVGVLVDQALQFDASKRWSNAGAMRFALRLAYRSIKDDDSPDSAGDGIGEETAAGRIPRPPMYTAPSIPPLSMRPRAG